MGRVLKFFASMRRGASRGGHKREELLAACTKAVTEKNLFLDKTLSLDILAREVGTNRLYLSRALSLSGGFCAYINAFRIQYAADLMASAAGEGMRLSEIAEKSGFFSERGMNYYLVRHCGITAREMRRRVMAGAQAKNFSTSFMASGSAKTATRS